MPRSSTSSGYKPRGRTRSPSPTRKKPKAGNKSPPRKKRSGGYKARVESPRSGYIRGQLKNNKKKIRRAIRAAQKYAGGRGRRGASAVNDAEVQDIGDLKSNEKNWLQKSLDILKRNQVNINTGMISTALSSALIYYVYKKVVKANPVAGDQSGTPSRDGKKGTAEVVPLSTTAEAVNLGEKSVENIKKKAESSGIPMLGNSNKLSESYITKFVGHITKVLEAMGIKPPQWVSKSIAAVLIGVMGTGVYYLFRGKPNDDSDSESNSDFDEKAVDEEFGDKEEEF
jgi:hypothetical protein